MSGKLFFAKKTKQYDKDQQQNFIAHKLLQNKLLDL